MYSAVRFDKAYRERVALPNGELVLVRPLGPSDRGLVDRAFKGLSEQTRYRRFHHVKSKLSREELRFFTHMDGWHHFALAVCASGPEGSQILIATARFVRSDSDDTAAEAALTVVDAWQGKGVGTVLLARLIEAAAERGVQRLHFTFLHENAPARRLLERCGQYLTFGHLDSVIAAELHVPHEDQYAGRQQAPRRLHRAYAAGRPAPAPALAPLSIGLSGFQTWMQQTRTMLGLLERWQGMIAQRAPGADAERSGSATAPAERP